MVRCTEHSTLQRGKHNNAYHYRCKRSAVQQLSLTNSVAAENTVTFSATGLPGVIPDNDLTNPLDKTIAVSGIPAGSVIKNVRVRMNVNHTWVGDMVANLTAPNGQTLNLFALMAGLTGSNGTANFTNTVFDSLATTGIAAAPAPRTGNFKPEAYLLTGPANFVTTTAYWAPLWGTINGNWRVRFADAGAGDVGTVTALEITIVYTAPGLAQGVWAPAASIFTDAAGTIPYTGTPATTVYVKPTTAGVTNYTVSYSTGVCQSGTTTVAVTARQLPTSVSAVANKSICQGGNTSFTSTVVGGSPSGLQWQVSTDNGTTYTNVADGGVYSGATTSTLNITGAGTNISNGRYRLVASAAPCAGTLASTAGILTVNPLPVLGLSTSLASIYPGQTATLTVTSSTTVPAGGYTWYRNGVIVPGATGNTLVVDVDGVGEYTVTAADANGCGNAVPASVSVASAPNEMMFIYPSPNTGVFQIRYFSAAGNNPLPRMVNIYDSKGARVYSKTYTVAMPYTKLDVDMTGFQKGIYQVELSDRNGNRIKTGRVLIL
ncbi:MAG: T9SS type A sorting domain-containing protein [Chitinophagaceae bacterium]|nr:MAG: T9SS type A sorting domain-containing protein [Chitinophagaceae bacterium]